MAILFDQLQDFDYIYRYNGAFSSNLKDSTTLDYFDDDASINDYIVFGYNQYVKGWPFHDLRFDVGTPLAASSITVVWEYLKSSGWTTIPGVTDNTNAFQNAGVSSVTFNVPEDWYYSPSVNGVTGFWVRCRITAVAGITEGGAQQNSKVQAKDWAIEVTGYSAVTPALAVDIWNADQSGVWDVFTRLNDTLYHCESNLIIGDGTPTSYLTFKDIVIVVEGQLFIRKWAYFDLGVLVDAVEKTTSNGAYLEVTKKYSNMWTSTFVEAGTNEFNVYGSYLKGIQNDVTLVKAYNSVLEDCQNIRPKNASSDFNRLSVIVSTDTLGIWPSSSSDYNDIFVYETTYALRTWAGNNTITMSNVKIRNCPYIWIMQGSNGNNETLNMVNADSDTWGIYWDNTFYTDSYLNRQYTVDIEILNGAGNGIENATVILRDENDDLVFSVLTDGDGKITQQIVTAHQYSWASGSDPGATTDTDYSPFSLTIRRIGFQTIQKLFTLDAKVDWCERLQTCCPVFDGLGG